MKRWLVMMMAAVGALTLAAHAGAQPLDGTLKRIKDTGTFKIGFRENSPPFSYLGADKKPLGYSVDLCERIARATQQELKLADLKIQYVPVTVESRIDAVANGTVDIECGSTTMTLARQEKVDFTNLTFVDGGGFLVARGSAIRGVTDLAGKRIGVIPGTTTEGALKAELQRAGVTASLVSVPDHNRGFAAVQGGQADAYASDQIILVGLLVQANAADRFALADQQFSFEPYAFAMRRNDPDFKLAVNTVLARLYRGAQIMEIYERWFGKFGKPSPSIIAVYMLNGVPE